MKIELKIEKYMKNGLHVRFSNENPIGIVNFRLDFPFSDRKSWIADRKSGISIGILEFRSEIHFSDPISNFPIFFK